MQYCFDVETLGIESTAVILSFAIIPFTFEDDFTYEQYLNRSLFVKFNAEEQIKKYKRTVTPSSMEFWAKQAIEPRRKSFIPSADDVSVEIGINKLEKYLKERADGSKQYAWARGGLDQVTIDSLTRAVRGIDADPLFPYNNWMDVRTALSITKETAGQGYCQIPGFDRSIVMKHDPIHDCAYDIMMMVKGK